MNKKMILIATTIIGLTWLMSSCAGEQPNSVTSESIDTPIPSPTPVPPMETAIPSPTDTPEPTNTPTPDPSPTPTPDQAATAQAYITQTAEAIVAEIGEEMETVDLSTDTGYLLWAQDEPVAIDLNAYQEWIYDPFAPGLVSLDFVLKTDITWESSSGLVTCGLFFRSEDNFEQGKQYLYEMLRLSGLPGWDITFFQDGKFQKSISDFRTNSAIRQDQNSTNKIMLIAEGEKFTLYINDTRAGSFYDYSKSILEGHFAYSARQESGESTCTFTNTWVWALE
ncbi:MAG: hypothetical protein JSV42_15495 [Chloroflexota bacterium]|nr:MAG: hypothetical protein JSV42_15495 [Chloroflexota bacterium]